MKTTLELLVRLAEVKKCAQRLSKHGQITNREKVAAECLQRLIRESLPGEVLPYFDTLFETEAQLVDCPEVFAMAVVVATYREVTPSRSKKLLTFFEIPKRAQKPKLARRSAVPKGNCPWRRNGSRALAV